MKTIVEPKNWNASFAALSELTGLDVEHLVLEVPVSVEGGRLMVTSRSGKAVDLEQHIQRAGCDRQRQLFLSVRHTWALPKLDAKLRDPAFAAMVFGIFIDSAWVLQRNNPKHSKVYDTAHSLPHLLGKAYINVESSLNLDFAGTVAGVVWHPVPDDDFRRHAIECGQRHRSLIYCLPHGLSFIKNPKACFEADIAALEGSSFDMSKVIVMASEGHEHRWQNRNAD